MNKEKRYIVLKTKDVSDFLNKEQLEQLYSITNTINNCRAIQKRGPMNAMVIEHDWPEYKPVCDAVERRVDNAPQSHIDIVFKSISNSPNLEFVEAEDAHGKGINIGEWVEREDNFRALRIPDFRSVIEII